MVVYLFLTAAVLSISFLIKNEDTRAFLPYSKYNYIYSGYTRKRVREYVALFSIFVLLVLVSSLRLNVGNDYSNYVEFMHRTYSGAYVPTEAGFNALTKLIYSLSGFENYVLVFAVFAFFTVYFFLKAIYKESCDFVMSFMMYMLLGYYFQSISTVRYYLALSIALYGVHVFLQKDYPRFVLLVLIGALFHKSLLLVLLLYPLASLKWKRWMLGLAGIFCISCLFFSDTYLKIAIALYPSYQGTEYLSGGTSYVNIFRCIAVLILAILSYGKDVLSDKKRSFYFYCNLMALSLYIFASFLPTVSRIAYYLTVTHILYVPQMLKNMTNESDDKKARLGMFFKVISVLACIAYFIMYMRHASDDGVRILPYETFLFHDMPATLSERGFG